MNLILSFVHVNKPTKTVGPFQAIRLDGRGLRDAANDELIALNRAHQWQVQGVRYYRLDSTSRVRIRFDQSAQGRPESRPFGPYARFSAVDGVAYVDDRVFAYVDAPTRNWFCYEDGHHWRTMVVTDASTRRASRLSVLLAAFVALLHGVIAPWPLSLLGKGTRLFGGLAQPLKS